MILSAALAPVHSSGDAPSLLLLRQLQHHHQQQQQQQVLLQQRRQSLTRCCRCFGCEARQQVQQPVPVPLTDRVSTATEQQSSQSSSTHSLTRSVILSSKRRIRFFDISPRDSDCESRFSVSVPAAASAGASVKSMNWEQTHRVRRLTLPRRSPAIVLRLRQPLASASNTKDQRK